MRIPVIATRSAPSTSLSFSPDPSMTASEALAIMGALIADVVTGAAGKPMLNLPILRAQIVTSSLHNLFSHEPLVCLDTGRNQSSTDRAVKMDFHVGIITNREPRIAVSKAAFCIALLYYCNDLQSKNHVRWAPQVHYGAGLVGEAGVGQGNEARYQSTALNAKLII